MSGLLVVNLWESRCDECGKGCDPYAKAHEVEIGLGAGGAAGCGAAWDRVGSDYTGMEKRVREMRPDLTWVDLWA